MELFQTILLRILYDANAAIFIAGALMTFKRCRKSRPARIQIAVFFIWGLAFLLSAILLHVNGLQGITYTMDPFSVMSSSFYFVLMMLVPLEVVYPRWLNWTRLCLLFQPINILIALYFTGVYLTDEKIERFVDFSGVYHSLSQFNVWFRFSFIILLLSYLCFFYRLILRYEARYIAWMKENFANEEYLDVSWMRYYICLVFFISMVWLGIVLTGNAFFYIVHAMLVMGCFTCVLYKELFGLSPYPEDFSLFCLGENKVDEMDGCTTKIVEDKVKESRCEDDTFESKLPLYVNKVTEWMDVEKPYLFKDFKLTDVSRQLPLNRTYLSRVFNDGLGKSFSDVVRAYRVDYSKTILLEHSDYPLHIVAQLCGFTSDSTFIRAFIKEMGISPSQYKVKGKILSESAECNTYTQNISSGKEC